MHGVKTENISNLKAHVLVLQVGLIFEIERSGIERQARVAVDSVAQLRIILDLILLVVESTHELILKVC
ncbi:hypothetical protein CCR75_003832 [Bremia lactucae]|uniref:Uncharacterized protein n=1 Tax=Bremia lactucae TaxID=4779 RepID=A0A976NZG1_BRELC|nr:hypothetical protein CCR75_003832 [Bremia lactucae]